MNLSTSIRTIVVATCCLLMAAGAVADDFDVIYQRMYEKYLSKNPGKETVDGLLKLMSPDGAFINLNYRATDGSPRKHVQHLITLACAYQQPQNAYYHNYKLKEAYLKSLNFWVDTNHQAQNWWYRYIPYPKELSASVVLMNQEIKQDKALFDKTISYLRWSYEKAAPRHMTGANGADIIMGSLAASILTRNEEQMKDYQQKMSQLLTIQPVEGIQPDYLFAQHCGSGRQLYFTSYGKEFVNSMLSYLEFCKGTQYQSEGVDLLQQLFIQGVQWVFFSRQYDPNNAGRYIHSNQFSDAVKALAERVYKLSDPDTKEASKLALQHIGGDNGLQGNRMFWRFDYMINRRTNYMASSRMTSTRTVGNEAGNGDGNFNYYASNGVNYLFVTGREYDRDFFKRFNNRQYPGITAEQGNEPLPIPDWGEGGGNGSDFAGGVSDSIYGACGMKLDRHGLQAHKAWFYFDNEYVCLGSGISNPQGKAEVLTTINQCNADGKVNYENNGKATSLKGKQTLTGNKWVLHGQVGYFLLDPKATCHVSTANELFSLTIDHGQRPTNGSYAYLVCPGMKKTAEAQQYATDLPVEILSNTTELQAVRHKSLGLTEAIFYAPASLTLPDGTVLQPETPCALLWNEKTGKLNLANPRCESENPASIRVNVSLNGQTRQLDIALPQAEKSGLSVATQVR